MSRASVRSRPVRAAQSAALVLASLAIALGLAEIGARWILPPDQPALIPAEQQVVQFDAELGWRNRPGTYRASFQAGGRSYPVTTTIGPTGERRHALSPAAEDAREDVAVVGCSYTFGCGVNDDDVYAARLARAEPGVNVVNLGTNGYGTYQALLTLERRYAQRPPPRVVIYGFLAHHAARNAATARWRAVVSAVQNEGAPRVPYVTLDAAGQLVRHPPEGLPPMPLCGWSRLCRELRLLSPYHPDPPPPAREEATRKLIAAMRDWAAARGARLVVALLESGDVPRYEAFLRGAGIPFVKVAKGYRFLPFDPIHPTEEFHADVAARLVTELRDDGALR